MRQSMTLNTTKLLINSVISPFLINVHRIFKEIESFGTTVYVHIYTIEMEMEKSEEKRK